MKMMGKEFAVTVETASAWRRYSLMGNGENAIYRQASLCWQEGPSGTRRSGCGHGLS